MCGFAGIIHWNGETVFPEELGQMAGRIRHRGPDRWQTAFPSKNIGLAHTRLKVIDLSDAADQPMANDSREIWIVFNGEIYNFRELQRELRAKGFHFRSQSDTEVFLRAYEAWGVEAVQKLEGMFAAAIWDGRTQELWLIRDRVGKKPLFYWTDGRCLAFGSEIKALLAHPHVPNEIHEEIISHLLAFGYPPTGQTCYQGIHQLPPASVIGLSQRNPLGGPKPYWDLCLKSSHAPASDKKAAMELRELLSSAVDRRLVSDVPLGAFLSGGIDSTIVVGLMSKRIADRPVKTFSIGFSSDPRFNETHYAELAAKRFGTQHTTFTVTPQSFDLLEKLVWHYDQPFGDSSAIPMYLLCRLAREHVTVALSGDGGDESFAGYDRFLAALWADFLPPGALNWASRLVEILPTAHERSWMARAKRFAAVSSLPLPERYLRLSTYIDYSSSPSIAQLWERSKGLSPLSRLLDLNFKEYLPNDLMVKTDRCSMAHGLEVRSPLLDTPLIEYAAALPDRFKVRGCQTKVLLKKACADLLPPEIRNRKKMGFGVPLGTWFRQQWREPLQDTLGSRQARVNRYLEPSRIQSLIDSHLEEKEDAGHRLWLLMTLEVWLRQREGSQG
ncbi:MAG: asparagine synthase (glutamine-hydrolyzing) [Candidatus Omnitrophica bacterium]|nr:asparagine synthase (glutamine-hydrolyzing) [Candidatus Omnitrophota bacterium]